MVPGSGKRPSPSLSTKSDNARTIIQNGEERPFRFWHLSSPNMAFTRGGTCNIKSALTQETQGDTCDLIARRRTPAMASLKFSCSGSSIPALIIAFNADLSSKLDGNRPVWRSQRIPRYLGSHAPFCRIPCERARSKQHTGCGYALLSLDAKAPPNLQAHQARAKAHRDVDRSQPLRGFRQLRVSISVQSKGTVLQCSGTHSRI